MKAKYIWCRHDSCADCTPFFGLVKDEHLGVHGDIVPAQVVPSYLENEEAAGMSGVDLGVLVEGNWYDVTIADGYIVGATPTTPPDYVAGVRLRDAVITYIRTGGDQAEVRFTNPNNCRDHVWLLVPPDSMRDVPMYATAEVEWHHEPDTGEGYLDRFVAIRNVRPASWDASQEIPLSQSKNTTTQMGQADPPSLSQQSPAALPPDTNNASLF